MVSLSNHPPHPCLPAGRLALSSPSQAPPRKGSCPGGRLFRAGGRQGRGDNRVIWLENKIFNPKKCRGASLGAPDPSTNSGGGHTCLPVGREGRPYELTNQPIRLPGLEPWVCSGLILSGAFYPDLKIGVWRRRTYQFSWLLATR